VLGCGGPDGRKVCSPVHISEGNLLLALFFLSGCWEPPGESGAGLNFGFSEAIYIASHTVCEAVLSPASLLSPQAPRDACPICRAVACRWQQGDRIRVEWAQLPVPQCYTGASQGCSRPTRPAEGRQGAGGRRH
jgi:hypothetical protein